MKAFVFIALLTGVVALSENKLRYGQLPTRGDEDNRGMLPQVDESIILRAFNTAEKSVKDEERANAESRTRRETRKSYHGHTVKEQVKEISRDAEIVARAINILATTNNFTREASERLIKRAAPRFQNFDVLCSQRQFRCSADAKFRNFDGSCNNLDNPDWGMAVVRMNRLIPPDYGDRFNSPRVATSGRQLPLARFVSTTTIPDINNEHSRLTHMVMSFGQFIDHDITSTPHRTDLADCCRGNTNPDCFPIRVPRDDEQLAQFRIGCMEFERSHRACGNGLREQINQNTAFIDGSQMYGSSVREAANLRTFQGGFLQSTNNGNNPPVNPNDQSCATVGTGGNFCFRAGDDRVNIQPGLISLHALFLREHNRVARILRSMAPSLSDEILFQETRRVMIAQMENIVYSEFLPIILGPTVMRQFELNLPEDGTATAHTPDINPNMINSFATAAYRFGHSLIQNEYKLGSSNGDSFQLRDNFNDPRVIYRAGVDAVLMGSVSQKAQAMENFMASAVTRFLFKSSQNNFGLDLAAINLQRGRDHGLPGYNEFREFCDLPRIRSFSELGNVFSDSRAAGAFQQAYEHVDDIELWAAGLAETPVSGGTVGPTFACILGTQFHRLLYGDRHFFTHGNQPGSFTPDERVMLRQRTLSSIICDNTGVNSVQRNAFLMPGSRNPVLSCQQHPKIDFRIFF